MSGNLLGVVSLYHEILKRLRAQKEVTQLQLAEALGRPQSFVSKYESGERRLDVLEFIQVCNALNESPSDVIQKIEKGRKRGI
ncbi:helix-turn-helix transcriptional regulator [Alcanivorax sp.]|uniref:helix-turn-helix domain-containing protein n=1 Tax=Alcanivorax sp. TaxID=1872427 RepID=UPI0025C61443|nr:helix-turn-helix transcriptional regulator [Alcanivorax sp.]